MSKEDDINNYVPSLLNPRRYPKSDSNQLTQNSITSRFSLSLGLKKSITSFKDKKKSQISVGNKENSSNVCNVDRQATVLNDAETVILNTQDTTDLSFSFIENSQRSCIKKIVSNVESTAEADDLHDLSHDTILADTEDCIGEKENDDTLLNTARPLIEVSFSIENIKSVDVYSKSCIIKRIVFNHEQNNVNVDCQLIENLEPFNYELHEDSMYEMNTNETKKVSVNLEIEKRSNTEDNTEESGVLILKTNAIEGFGHVIVQPPNYKLVKRKINHDNWKGNKRRLLNPSICNGNFTSTKLTQKTIHDFLPKIVNVFSLKGKNTNASEKDVISAKAMSKNSGIGDSIRRTPCKLNDKNNESPRSVKTTSMRREIISPRSQDLKPIRTETPHTQSAKVRNESASAHWPRKGVETLNFSLPAKSKSNRTSISPRSIPHHKIVAGTHFAVDAFSYGDIPNVKNYFLTHFHSDHYTGLKKSFNKQLYCSRITADLCISRLGVNPKCIHVISIDETIRIDGVEITAVDANHCPGALMLVFTLPNGKTLLHTGDFRASHTMESYPIFWNKDIHTVYLDTTYCNPRYDFPTQDQSLEMALQILRQKKLSLENAGKKFSSVLIVCGTYTIGKEKFFLGIARRVGCSVWACPEKDKILQVVEGQSFSHTPPHSCQLHVVPMRDLTHEKLRSYLDSLKGTFSEVVAFKPSGWENGKNSCVEKDLVTLHGIPYSEHSSFSELIRFVKYLKPKQVVPTVDISGGIKAVQKYFPCPLVCKDDVAIQSKVTDYYSSQNRQEVPAVT